MRIAPIAVSLLVVGTAACDGIFVDCKAYAAAGIEVILEDGSTGMPLSNRAAVVRAIKPGSVDSVQIDAARLHEGTPIHLAWEQRGTYRVEVKVEGYELWVRDGIRVTADECHVRTVRLIAELTPEDV